ncbi:DUF58 domain-containing protein [Oculatella sp. LEGE 06141]|uniref:DUF58 domain-containing protein n=1 Tax=Oculatella sp. LEGE 06141 TaxID=1828648 RepID=UPI00187FA244|nr:DUF58 domain-containing protein [Oculatella sp. LEGE 06141]MBE9181085.1 DUF58 domain-containing protein [Oculatella sp. LEGE 06141]
MLHRHITHWLETRWITPAYSGWLMTGLALFFFGAATNTMAGWLYVMSGVMLALLAIAAVLTERSLRQIQISRPPILPVSVGEPLAVELAIANRSNQPKPLFQVYDLLPPGLTQPAPQSIDVIPAQGVYNWRYSQPTQRRGVYRWQTVQLRTGAPLGLFWCRRQQTVKAIAIVYPTVLPLTQCPIIDDLGKDNNYRVQHDYRATAATEGLTRTVRPYRWGDSTRLIHWRSSARYGELRVRELENYTGGQELVVCLDSAIAWYAEAFEQAVTAAASLYFYAVQRGLQVCLWTAGSGLVRGDRAVLETLAAIQAQEEPTADDLPNLPLLWLTPNLNSVGTLPHGSRWLLWSAPTPPFRSSPPADPLHPGLMIQPNESLQLQLQAHPTG